MTHICFSYEETLARADRCKQHSFPDHTIFDFPFPLLSTLVHNNLFQSIAFRLNSPSPLTAVMVLSGFQGQRGRISNSCNSSPLPRMVVNGISFFSLFSCFQRACSNNSTLDLVEECLGLSFFLKKLKGS